MDLEECSLFHAGKDTNDIWSYVFSYLQKSHLIRICIGPLPLLLFHDFYALQKVLPTSNMKFLRNSTPWNRQFEHYGNLIFSAMFVRAEFRGKKKGKEEKREKLELPNWFTNQKDQECFGLFIHS